MNPRILLSIVALSFCLNSNTYAGGGFWDDLLKAVRQNKADTEVGASARNKLVQARMTQQIGDDVITISKTVARLREIIEANDAATHYGALARCNLVLMLLDANIGYTGLKIEEAVRLLNAVVQWQQAGTGQGVAARFLLVRMRLRGLIGDNVYTPAALTALMREVIDNYNDPLQRERQVANAEARIRDLTHLQEAGEQSDQERDTKKTKTDSAEEARVRAEVDRRLYPIAAPPPAIPYPVFAPAAEGNNNNNNNAAAEEAFDFGFPPRFDNSFADWAW